LSNPQVNQAPTLSSSLLHEIDNLLRDELKAAPFVVRYVYCSPDGLGVTHDFITASDNSVGAPFFGVYYDSLFEVLTLRVCI